ncbi:MAG: hypothetical protein MUE46_13975 [Xanthomonadales bacterium]|jgi:hypothetical protein|nr:hypothetical protein [Xanthomonadales bacterium]
MKPALYLLPLLVLSSAGTAAVPAAKVLIVDTEAAIAQSSVATRLRAEAEAARAKATGADAREQIEGALDLALSELLEALPALIEQMAMARGVDVVLEPAIASRVGAKGPEVTAELVKVLDRQTAKVRLELP